MKSQFLKKNLLSTFLPVAVLGMSLSACAGSGDKESTIDPSGVQSNKGETVEINWVMAADPDKKLGKTRRSLRSKPLILILKFILRIFRMISSIRS